MSRREQFEAACKVILEYPDYSIRRLANDIGIGRRVFRRARRVLLENGQIDDVPYICSDGNVSCHFPLERRFWVKVDKTDSCWIWVGFLDKRGYGRFAIDGKPRLAHRVSWEIVRGRIPDDLLVLHNCPGGDNPSCVNPDHLWIGTHAQNTADMIEKGRQRNARGSDASRSKLTEENVREIRRFCDNKTYPKKVIARMFGVTSTSVRSIGARRNWGWLED